MNVNRMKRQIKCIGSCIKPGDDYLHPVTLQINHNKNNVNICPSEISLINSKIYTNTLCKDIDPLTPQEIQKFMILPYLNLTLETMLSIYKIDTIDSLIIWINDMIKLDNMDINNNFIKNYEKSNDKLRKILIEDGFLFVSSIIVK